jgi:(2R)-ethylmalonyl-CoA mutase
VENAAQEAVRKWRAERDQGTCDKALAALREAAGTDSNLMAATLDCARAGVTKVFGEYRAPTGVAAASAGGEADPTLTDVRERVRTTGEELGGRLRFLVGKPGLDGHSNGAEQIAVRARDAGFEVVYQGIRLTPEQIVSAAVEEDVHVVGLSVLSGSHLQVVPAVLRGLKEAGLDDVPVVVGGIVPESDARRLRDQGVARVFTPKDFGLTDIMGEIVDVVRAANDLPAHPADKVPAPT